MAPSFRRASCRISAGALAAALVICATGGSVGAQTWRWGSVSSANGAALQTQSVLSLASGKLAFSSTAPSGSHRIVLASCRAALSDVQQASAVSTQGQVFVLIEFKPERAAACNSGKRTMASLPSNDFAQVNEIAAAVNSACCSAHRAPAADASPHLKRTIVALRAPAPSTPRPSAAPTAAPTGSPSATAGLRLRDWTEDQGVFAFVRVYNGGTDVVTISDGEVLDCRSVDVGCGPSPRRLVVDPRAVATIATVATADQRNAPSFSYRYRASAGEQTVSLSGSSRNARPHGIARISQRESRAAEAAALHALRGPATAPLQTTAATELPARLLTRGTSRLAIGEKGVALVRVRIAANGTPQEASVVSTSNRQLIAAAIETAVSSTYAPATKDGRAIAANYVATFSFNGEDPATADVPVWRRLPLPVHSASPR